MNLLSAIFKAARTAGGEVVVESIKYDYSRGRQQTSQTVLLFDGHQFGFSIVEEAKRSPHEPTKTELAQKARYSWTRIPDWDYAPSGRLSIRLGDAAGRADRATRSRFADRVTASVEDKIEDVIAEIVTRAQEASASQREADRLDALYAEERAHAVERAKADDLEVLRAGHARKQVQRWQEAEGLRAYAASLRQRNLDEEQVAWADWIVAEADRVDPPGAGPKPPRLPATVHDYQLGEYLRGWPAGRPYGWQPADK